MAWVCFYFILFYKFEPSSNSCLISDWLHWHCSSVLLWRIDAQSNVRRFFSMFNVSSIQHGQLWCIFWGIVLRQELEFFTAFYTKTDKCYSSLWVSVYFILNYSNKNSIGSWGLDFCCYNCSTLLRRLYWTLFVLHEFPYRCWIPSLFLPFGAQCLHFVVDGVLDTKFSLNFFCIEFFQVGFVHVDMTFSWLSRLDKIFFYWYLDICCTMNQVDTSTTC